MTLTPTTSRIGSGSGGGLFNAYALLQDQKAAGTDGGTFTAGAWQTRTLNTEVFDPSGIVSIAANQFTLQAGTYFVRARAPGDYCGLHKTRIRNVTDGATLIVGGNAQTAGTITDEVTTSSFAIGRFTLAAAKALELQHQCAVTRLNDGFGSQCNFGEIEVYAEVEIWREA